MIHKKINLANEMMAWEHERFSLNKVSAFTLSHYLSHKESTRTSISDTLSTVNRNSLNRNVKVIAESLAQYIYNNSQIEIFDNDLEISSDFLNSWLNYICSVPRSLSLMHKNKQFINTLFSHFSTYLKSATMIPLKLNSKDSEFVIYSGEKSNLVIYSVKPALFDLILSCFIGLYILMIYIFVTNSEFIINKSGFKL